MGTNDATYMREYQRSRRAKERGVEPDGSVVERAQGPVEAALLGEVTRMGEVSETLVQAALVLARDLDNPKAFTSHSSLADKLQRLMDGLRRDAGGRKNRLGAVRSMSSRVG